MYFKSLMIATFTLIVYQPNLIAETESLNPATRLKNQEQIQKDIQDQVQQARKDAQKSVVGDAVTVIDETQRSLGQIKSGHPAKALAALERATGKADILLARHPEEVCPPVSCTVTSVDVAPDSFNKIHEVINRSIKAMNARNYAASRSLVNSLRSEIHVEIACLPLATFPDALKDAARLVELGHLSQATLVLETALNTLVIKERVLPIPVIRAMAAITTSRNFIERTPSDASRLVDEGKFELRRALELGYLDKDENYSAIMDEIATLESEVQKQKPNVAYFDSLKERLKVYLKNGSRPKALSEQ